jgi:biotin operon repressor
MSYYNEDDGDWTPGEKMVFWLLLSGVTIWFIVQTLYAIGINVHEVIGGLIGSV